jgi:hypothetical protein
MEFSTPDSAVIFTPSPELNRAMEQLSSLTKNFPGRVRNDTPRRAFSRGFSLTGENGLDNDLSGKANVRIVTK